MVKINDVVEVYKWKKPRYLGKVVGPYPIGNRRFYKVSVLTPFDNGKFLHWHPKEFSTDTFKVDVVSEENMLRICDGTKTEGCDQCKHRFTCFATW